MSEIVVLQFGNAANAVGSEFWNLQMEHAYWKKSNADAAQLSDNCLLNELPSGKYQPRVVICDNKAGFGIINPQTGTSSKTRVTIKSSDESSLSGYSDLSHIQLVQQQRADESSLINHWSYPYEFTYSPHSLFEVSSNHSIVNPIDSIAKFMNSYSNQTLIDSLEDHIRYQLEQCDAISGVMIIEDTDLGWNGVTAVNAYLREEGISTLYSVGISTSSIQTALYNQCITTLASIRDSNLHSSFNCSPIITACCLDSFLSICKQNDLRRLSLSQVIKQYALGESRTLLNCCYGTMLYDEKPVDMRETHVDDTEPECNWKECYCSQSQLIKPIQIERNKTNINSTIVGIISRQLNMKTNRRIYSYNSRFVPNTLFHNAIITDPLLCPLNSISKVEDELPSLINYMEWYNKDTLDFNPFIATKPKNCDSAAIRLLSRFSNEKKSLDMVSDPINCLAKNEKSLRYWLKSKCNENNRDDEIDMMDLVDECQSISDRLFHDYTTL